MRSRVPLATYRLQFNSNCRSQDNFEVFHV